MLYGFTPSNNRYIDTASHNYHVIPELHPTRLLSDQDIFYVIDGYFSVRIVDEVYRFIPGDVAVIPAEYPHYGYEPCRANSHTIFIHFSKEEGDHKIDADTPEKKAESAASFLTLESKIHADNPVIFQYFQDMVKLFWYNVSHKEARLAATFSLLLAALHDASNNMGAGLKHDHEMQELASFINGHTDTFYTIAELAAQAGISPKSLTSRFRTETGQTVHQYQMNTKLEQIAALLRNESYSSLKNLAVNFGFCDEFHLSTAFKKKFSVAPKQYSRE
jgi:AraC-like DNA-binding protein